MAEPPDEGAIQRTTRLGWTNSVIGAKGMLGVWAERILTVSEKSERPNELRDWTLNS
jgi:hypothetical protein